MFYIRGKTWAYREGYASLEEAKKDLRYFRIRSSPQKIWIIEGDILEKAIEMDYQPTKAGDEK